MTVELFNKEFEGIVGQLKSYILRITASIADAEDIVHDTYLKALDKLHTIRGDSSLKTWLFAIASNLAKDNLRAQNRRTENVTDITKEAALNNRQFFQEAMNIRMTSPHGQYEAKEHIAFCFTFISKSLPLEQQLCIFLKEVLVCTVGKTVLLYDIRCLTDLHSMLKKHGDWMELGSADKQKPAKDGTVEAWGRSEKNPVKDWYGLKKGLRGRFGMYIPPLMEKLGLADVTHDAKGNKMKAK